MKLAFLQKTFLILRFAIAILRLFVYSLIRGDNYDYRRKNEAT